MSNTTTQIIEGIEEMEHEVDLLFEKQTVKVVDKRDAIQSIIATGCAGICCETCPLSSRGEYIRNHPELEDKARELCLTMWEIFYYSITSDPNNKTTSKLLSGA